MDSDFKLPPDIRDPFADDTPSNRVPDEQTQRDRPPEIDTENPYGGGEAPEETQWPRPIDTEYPSSGESPADVAEEVRQIDTEYPGSSDADFTMPPEIRDPFAD